MDCEATRDARVDLLKNRSTSLAVWPFWQSMRTSPVAMFIAANKSVVPSGRPGALLRPAPLRTGRATFTASGSSKP
jgi:predicted pyridoxine 5'-phosphate oxidase superfamily flavin-nucleotide-binding protein